MDNRAIHLAIRKKFQLSNRALLNLPHSSGRRYNRDHLAELLGELKFNRGAEVGVRAGRFSMMLCKCNPDLELFCIDPWNEYESKYYQAKQDRIYAEAVKNLAPYNATLIRKTSMDALADFEPESLDFVYIDGNHHYDFAAPDIIYWAQKVKRNGIVAVHDVYGGEVGVQKAVEGYIQGHHIIDWYITKELEPTAYWVVK
jgi:predicted O-methyltransferase YrrM